MNELILRECKVSDIPAVIELEKESFSDAWTKEQLESELSRFGFFGLVAECQGEIVGYALSGVLFERAELERIAVKTACRGQGIGGKLLDALVDGIKSRGASEILLEVREGNLSAIRLYESRNFTLFHKRKGYYAGGENALEMRKIIEG